MLAEELGGYVVDEPGQGVFAVHRDVYRDPAIFELEMRYIFERTWVFLGIEDQIAQPHDYLSTWIGRQPVLVMRNGEGQVGAFLNSCPHRGAILTQRERGNARIHVCAYHAWSFDSSGRCASIKDRKDGCYSEAFDRQSHDLVPVARFGSYRGLMFGSLSEDVPPLEDYLGETRFFLDLILDQSPHGIELLPGSSTYTYNGNWKLQLDNALDAYHLTSVHPSFMKIVKQRQSGESQNALATIDFAAYRQRGGFTFDHGHAAVWTRNPLPHIRPLYPLLDELRQRVGEKRASLMLDTRNLVIFPNVQFAENASLQLRVLRPLAVDRTEMRSYVIAPKGEPPEARELRLRQFEDFFNSSGLATPDDTTCYEDCQTGYRARNIAWTQGYARGMTSVQAGANEYAREFGITPATSQYGDVAIQDETVFHSGYREWRRLMVKGAMDDAAKRAAAQGGVQ
ncbi:aromatic ring-hydroxylating dioxygenase subunit alpha [uncultured Pigmentiphaga sp.]|jgi:Phenylpropionate dioxygenase and related ring-hydroxylating dioxygenases, large terminal subunit|uniref:aromatic ring-hydroxylating oxygenase subunit alpha n=1 Tax=uncultured Pigmentiphaga sp. TaxID=340361 RepID=UPI00262BD8A9|nr:aromatic ring-hydroxylating dioxygenase subunit alpha [uncultured Pigmentiphaga sp.]